MKELKKELPEFAITPRHIAQGNYRLEVWTNRLLKMAQRHFDFKNPNNRTVKFTFKDFFTAYGMSWDTAGDKTKFLIKKAFKELRTAGVDIMEELPGGGFHYEGFNFIDHISAYVWAYGMDEITIKFTDTMALLLAEALEQGYTPIELEQFGKISNPYAQRFYEIALSRKNQKDKLGNWFFEYTTTELRAVLKAENIYTQKKTGDSNFRYKLVDTAITAVNNADVGIQIKSAYRKPIRKDQKICFWCREVSPDNPKSAEPATNTEALRETFADEWKIELQKAQEKNKQYHLEFEAGQSLIQTMNENTADEAVRKNHPEWNNPKRGKK